MRKFFVALLVGAVAVGLAAPVFAADLKFSGETKLRFQFDKALNCLDRTPDDPAVAGTECDGHQFDMRVRPRFDVETEGGVRGVLRLEIGDMRFGTVSNTTRESIGGSGADSTNVETKNAYIDFPVPGTPLRLRTGIMPFDLSKGIILTDDGPGISLYGKLGEINANAWWFRANGTVDAGVEGTAARDIYALDLSFSPMRDLNVNGYVVYDHDMEIPIAGEAATGFWIGAAAAGKVQNIRWDLDFVYGTKEISATADQQGFAVDGGVGMALPGTPFDVEVRGWYATGNKEDGGDNEAIPVLTDFDHEPGTHIAGGGGLTDFQTIAENIQNTWGIGLIGRWAVSPALRVTGNIFYMGTAEEGQGTTDSEVGDAGGLTGVSSIGTEVSTRIDYTIHRGLVFTFVAGWLFLGDDQSLSGLQFDDAGKIAGQLAYNY